MIRISEIFGPTIQGEGALIGCPTVFVRTGGCDYRCSWCDTMHAVDSKYRDQWTQMSAKDIMAEVERLSGGTPLTITLSGGNPAIQDLSGLIKLGKSKGYDFAMETQGSIAQEWFSELDMLILSPKPPSSGMECEFDVLDEIILQSSFRRRPESIKSYKKKDPGLRRDDMVLKVVVKDDQDFEFAKNIHQKYPDIPFYMQPCNQTVNGEIYTDNLKESYEKLVENVLQEKLYDVTVLPQLHVWVWGNKQGV